MLRVYNYADPTDVIPLQLEDDKKYVTHKFDGYDTLTFEIESTNPVYRYIAEEVKIADEKNRYVVKSIDEHSDFVTVVCDLDIDEWKSTILYEFRKTNALLANVLSEVAPDGWTIVGAGDFTKRTTIEDIEGEPMVAVTPADILPKAAEAYGCVFNFDVINRVITCIDPTTYKPSGQFFMDDLNLKNLGYVGTSEGFATRLYAYGAKDESGNPLTFASINDGKPYVENHTYSNKVVSVGWSDERYTDAESLLRDAQARLDQLAYPSRSYSCDAKNLDEAIWLYKVVTLVDHRRRTRVNHQVVEFVEYQNHAFDTVTLSKVAPGIESLVNNVQSTVKDAVKQETANLQDVMQNAVDRATDKITGNQGGHFVWIFDANGKPIELLNLCDTDDINTAKSVWRWNASGLGFSSEGATGTMKMALTNEGEINANAITVGILTANLIRAGVLQSADGSFYLDLETGVLQLNANQMSINGKDVDASLSDAEAGIQNATNVANSAASEVGGLRTDVNKAANTVQEVEGRVTNQLGDLARYIKYGAGNALTIGTGAGEITLAIDPINGIVFAKDGTAFGDWDGVDFHTGNIIIDVNERAQLGNFAFVPRSDGSLMFLKVAGASSPTEDDTYEEFIPPGSGGGDTPQFTYTVNDIAGATYGFVLNSNGYYESTNKGVNSSYSVCRVNFVAPSEKNVDIWVINSGETSFDYGVIGNVDTALSTTITDDSYSWKAGSNNSSEIIAVTLTISAGEHFVDIKYRKDSSQHTDNDSLQFRIEVA